MYRGKKLSRIDGIIAHGNKNCCAAEATPPVTFMIRG